MKMEEVGLPVPDEVLTSILRLSRLPRRTLRQVCRRWSRVALDPLVSSRPRRRPFSILVTSFPQMMQMENSPLAKYTRSLVVKQQVTVLSEICLCPSLFPNLVSLDISTIMLKVDDFAKLNALSKLEELRLSFFLSGKRYFDTSVVFPNLHTMSTNLYFLALKRGKAYPNLKSLTFTTATQCDIPCLLKSYPQLTYLDTPVPAQLTECSFVSPEIRLRTLRLWGIDDRRGFEYIPETERTNATLESITIFTEGHRLVDSFFPRLKQNFRMISEVIVYSLSNEQLDQLPSTLTSLGLLRQAGQLAECVPHLRHLTEMRKLRLDAMSADATSFVELLQELHELRRLALCYVVNSVAVDNPNAPLKSLTIRRANTFDTRCFKLPNLLSLTLGSATSLNDDALGAISDGCPMLARLNITFNDKLTAARVRKFLDANHQLQSVSLLDMNVDAQDLARFAHVMHLEVRPNHVYRWKKECFEMARKDVFG